MYLKTEWEPRVVKSKSQPKTIVVTEEGLKKLQAAVAARKAKESGDA